MRSKYPICATVHTRSVVAHTTDGREITVPTAVIESDSVLAWSEYARIEVRDGRG